MWKLYFPFLFPMSPDLFSFNQLNLSLGIDDTAESREQMGQFLTLALQILESISGRIFSAKEQRFPNPHDSKQGLSLREGGESHKDNVQPWERWVLCLVPCQRPNSERNDSKTSDKFVVSEKRGMWAFFPGVAPGKEQNQRRHNSTVCIGREGHRPSGVLGPFGVDQQNLIRVWCSSGLREPYSPSICQSDS